MNTETSSPKVHPPLFDIAKVFRPSLKDMSHERQVIGIGNVITFLYAAPLALIGLIWLVSVTDWILIRSELFPLAIFAALFIFFNRLRFFLIIELRTNRYGSSDGSLVGIVMWSGIFLFGPSVLWLSIMWTIFEFVVNWKKAASSTSQWSQLRNLAINLSEGTIAPLLAISIFLYLGGEYPLPGLSINVLVPAFAALLAHLFFVALIWAGYLVYSAWGQKDITGAGNFQPILRFFLLAISLPHLAHPFAILAAGLYIQTGMMIYLFFISGMLLVALLARQLSRAAESSRQQSRLLERLEQLGRAIINAPPDTENLPSILKQHLNNMFPAGRLVIWIFPEDVLMKQPIDWQPELEAIWPWLLDQTEGQALLARDSLPWETGAIDHDPVVVAPIRETESGQTFGGIYLELHTLAQPWDRRSLDNLYPAVQSLAAQIASAVNQAKVYIQALEYQRVSEELKLAGSIQSSLLPHSFPSMPGWQLAVTLDPAGETSGDFFDIIPLSDGKIGIVIADVLDKGVGPALYMTLSRTLIRIYATEFDLQPDIVFFATNERILKDTSANLFVTAFYGVLNPETGMLTYSNAGHNPPYLINSQNGDNPLPLTKTGLPIGIDEEATWEHSSVEIHPGDVLILYTDGIPDAQNSEGQFFRQETLVNVIKENLGQSAEGLQKSILDAVYQFVGDAPPFDDITLIVLVRDR